MRKAARPALFWVLVALLALELAAVAAVVVVLLVDLAIAHPASWPTAIALTVLVVIAAGWMSVTVVGLLRGRAWVRASAVVWQVLQFAIGLGALQGAFAQPAWGWPLMLVAAAAFAVLFAPSVVRVTSARDPR